MSTEAEFTALAERHRRELHVHCYRMLGNFEEAEDLVQETMLRAWRRRDTLEREERLRPWLYRIATNACLDAIDSRGRRVPSLGAFRDVPWLQPYPDRLLESRAAIVGLLEQAFGPEQEGEWRLVPTRANRHPAAASYLRAFGDDTFHAFKIDVLRMTGGRIAEITTFDDRLFEAFGLPRTR